MLMLNVIRRSAISSTRRVLLPCSGGRIASQWPLTQNTFAKRPLLARFESNTTTPPPAPAPTPVPAEEPSKRPSPSNPNIKYTYPEKLNIYRAGTFETVWLGSFRIICLFVGVAGVLFAAPNIYFNPESSNYWIPAVILGAPVPYLLTSFLQGPVVHAIRVTLPAHARKDKAALLRWAKNTPGDTWLQMQCIRFTPWPRGREVSFGALRKMKPSLKGGMSNLENAPAYTRKLEGKEKGGWWHEAWQRWFNRFYVDRSRRDLSQAKGVWEELWKQIPEAGSKEDVMLTQKIQQIEKTGQAKPAYRLANRPAVASTEQMKAKLNHKRRPR